MNILELKEIHKHCTHHYQELMNSKMCGCFHCKKMFAPSEIKFWIREGKNHKKGPGKTAHCPFCIVDSVVGDASGYEITETLLEEMNQLWFKSKKS